MAWLLWCRECLEEAFEIVFHGDNDGEVVSLWWNVVAAALKVIIFQL